MPNLFALAPVLAILLSSSVSTHAAEKPNIVFLLCDDLGFADVGAFGQQKIRTPNVDRLAAEGMKLNTHYSGNAVCAPSRSVLMTGLHPGHTFIRDNRQYRKESEGQWPIPAETVTLAEVLKDLGYTTGAFGKWGLGAPDTTGEPLKQGIDRFFGYNCQAVAHNFYPTYLWNNGAKLPLDNPPFAAHQKFPADADPNDPASYARYSGKVFAPDLITAQALKFIRDNKDRPFFLFYPTTVPHLALQVPEDSLEEYAGKFPEEPYLGNKAYLPHRTPRAAYAAMVTRLDREIGRLMQEVAAQGLDDNTIFVFSSDNGPLYDKLGGTDTDFFQSAGDFRGRKGSLYEGGVRVPTIVRWKGKIAAGTESNRVSGFEDWFPTLVEIAGGSQAIPAGLDGISLLPTLLGNAQPERPFLYREFPSYGGQQSIRVGDWKAIRQNLNPPARRPLNPGPIELYNLAIDPTESKDVASHHPDLVAKLSKLMAEQHVKSEIFAIRALDESK